MLATVTMGVHAEHEANHRYVVRGYVLDVSEVPLANVPVSIRVNAKPVGSVKTNTNGYYSLQTHLHDEDLGKLIEVRAGAHSGVVRMRGKQGDLSTARIHYVSFIGER